MPKDHPLKPFLCPHSVALIGVSRRTGRGAFNILDNLIELRYEGEIYPVNPHADTILGHRVYHTIADLPEEIDLAVLMLQRDLVPSSIEACAKKGILFPGTASRLPSLHNLAVSCKDFRIS